MRILIENEFLRVEEHTDRRVLVVRRLPTPAPPGREADVYMDAIQLDVPGDGWGLVVDVRAIPGRNDPEFERDVSQMRQYLGRRFDRVVVLVRSAVGQLQVDRMNRADGVHAMVTRDEDEAMALAEGRLRAPSVREA